MIGICGENTKLPKISFERIDESKCDNCHQADFYYYCEDCNEHLCIECNQVIHQRGKKSQHNRIDSFSRQPQTKPTHACREHLNEQLSWFCKTCNHVVCNKCCDKSGSHRGHDFVLCSGVLDELKDKVNTKYAEVASKESPTREVLFQLESSLCKLGVQNLKTIEKPPLRDEEVSVSSINYVTTEIKTHFNTIRKRIDQLEGMYLELAEETAQSKAQLWKNHIERLDSNLTQLSYCSDRREAMFASSTAEEACARYSTVMKSMDELLTQWDVSELTCDSWIPVNVRTLDVISSVDTSCFVGGPSSPVEVVLVPRQFDDGVEVSWKQSEVDDGKPAVAKYEVVVRMCGVDRNRTDGLGPYILPVGLSPCSPVSTPLVTATNASLLTSSIQLSDRLSISIKDNLFEGKHVYAIVTAVDANGTCSGKGISKQDTLLPKRLRYKSDFDRNGVLYYIGSAGGTRAYVNPYESGDVGVTWSSVEAGVMEYFVNNQYMNTRCGTKNVSGSWMMVDLGAARRLCVSHYSLRHDVYYSYIYGGHFLRNWVLEGKVDDSANSAWVVLRAHVNDASINRSGATFSWSINNSGHQTYRYLRIRMTGVNSTGNHNMVCSGIELYGDLYISIA